MTMTRLMLFSLLAGVLAACAAPGQFVPEKSTITEVRAGAGTPTDIRFAQNGDELWEYAKGPSGTETYLLRFGRDGRVKSVTQLLTEEQFGKILPGQTTKGAARDLLGRPSNTAFMESGTAWSWHVRVGGRDGQFVVSFGPDGVARDKKLNLAGGQP
jgi:hypothetical protein